MNATGGIVGGVSLVVAIWFADSPNAVRASLTIVFFCGLFVIYECGRRLGNLEDRLTRYENKNRQDLVSSLMLIESRRGDVFRMSADEYAASIKDGQDLKTNACIEGIFEIIESRYGKAEAGLFLSDVGMQRTHIDPERQNYQNEKMRQNTLDDLDQYAARLNDLIGRTSSTPPQP